MSRSNDTRVPDVQAHDDAARLAHIRTLNDAFRQRFSGGRIMITAGVGELARDHYVMALRRVATFTDFTPHNDPWDEHDFGAVEVAGIKLFWKIDYYDADLVCGSPDPADPAVTTRVLTIMLAEEY